MGRVVEALAPIESGAEPPNLDEDRFLLYWQKVGTAEVAFVDHVPSSNGGKPPGSEPEKEPLAGAGAPIIELAYGSHSQEKSLVRPTWRAQFALPGSIGGEFGVGIRPLDSIRLQSVWAAASLRRNALINETVVDPMFVYRTSEIYLQEALVPRLKIEESISLGARPPESLAKRLQTALVPLFAGAKKATKVPVQIRLGIESIRMVGATNPPPSGGLSGFIGEADPKLQIVEAVGSDELGLLAARISARLTKMMEAEPIGRPEDVRLVLSVTALSSEKQPLLEIARILVPLDNLSPPL